MIDMLASREQNTNSLTSIASCVSTHGYNEQAGLTAEKRVMVSVLVFWLYEAFWLRTIKLAWRVSLSKVRVSLTGDQTIARRRTRRVRLKNLVVRLCMFFGTRIASSCWLDRAEALFGKQSWLVGENIGESGTRQKGQMMPLIYKIFSLVQEPLSFSPVCGPSR